MRRTLVSRFVSRLLTPRFVQAAMGTVAVGVVLTSMAGLLVGSLACSSNRPELEKFHVSGRVEPIDFPDVPAVVLLDRTELIFTFSAEKGRPYASSLHTRRIQVLKPEGLELSRVLIPFDDRSRIFHIQGKRITEKGDITEMAADRFVEVERYAKGSPPAKLYGDIAYHLTRVSDVQVGDVFEVSYLRVWRDPRWVDPIRVSGTLPVVRGEVVIDMPKQFDVDYRVTRMGKVVDVKPTKIPTRVKGVGEVGEGVPGSRLAWIFDKERAVYPEELQPAPDALATQIHVQLKGYALGGKQFSAYTSWDDVANWYRELTAGKDQASADVDAVLTEIGAKSGSKRDKLQKIQRYLQNVVADVPAFMNLAALPAQTPGTIIKAKIGDAKDQASLTLAMLRGAGIDGMPVLVARNGSFAAVPDLPTPAPFNHVVIAIPSGGRYSFIDPSTPFLPTGRLPGALQGGRGLLVRPDGSELIDLPEDPPTANKVDIAYDLALARDGMVSGQARASIDGLDAAFARALLANPTAALVDEMKALLVPSGSKLRWLEVLAVGGAKAMDPDATLKLQIVIGPSSLAIPKDDGTINVSLVDVAGRPLPWLWREVRYTPLELPHKTVLTVKANIDLPESLGVKDLPTEHREDTTFLHLHERFAVAAGEIFLESKLTVDVRSLPPEDVPTLRAPAVRTWALLDLPITIVPGGFRGADYGTDPF